MTFSTRLGRDQISGLTYQLPKALFAVAITAVCPVAKAADEPAPPPPPSAETIVVTSEKLPVETLINRKVYSVTSDVQSTFGTLERHPAFHEAMLAARDSRANFLRYVGQRLGFVTGNPTTHFLGHQ